MEEQAGVAAGVGGSLCTGYVTLQTSLLCYSGTEVQKLKLKQARVCIYSI